MTVKIGDEVLGKESADQRGEWVLVPEKPLPGGAGELHLEEKTASGERRSSEEAVVVYVPERAPKDTGGQGAVVVATPRAGGASRILQAPAPPDRGPTAADAQGASGSRDLVAAPTDAQAAAQDTAPQPLAPRTDKDLSLEVIDYDEEGHVVLSGKAPPGSEVRATVDEETVGTVQADKAGEWQIAPPDPVVSDSHAIRIEQVGEGGVVLAKLSVPFSRAAVRPGELAPGTVVIEPGNNLWRIARATYGAGVKYTLIFAANADQIDNPHLIYPDQIFVVPPEALPDRSRRSAP
ncbi:MAG: LysM peptidoglycan-binding domain-containing protein [Alphaproteobacteria bacterium]|nr:LysM peptidoglycan-binding domain-containing protein [Alphaproteobacteria bacterium]